MHKVSLTKMISQTSYIRSTSPSLVIRKALYGEINPDGAISVSTPEISATMAKI